MFDFLLVERERKVMEKKKNDGIDLYIGGNIM
jgi:hypothetical protein